MDIDWSWNISTLHNFCSILIEQLINLRKVKSYYSKLPVLSGTLKVRTICKIKLWWVSNTVHDCLHRQIAEKIKNWNLSCPNIAFHLLPIWVQTLVAINSEWCRASFPSFCVPPDELLCCLIQIWADMLSSAAFHRNQSWTQSWGWEFI